MGELIKELLFSYILVTGFAGIMIFMITCGTVKKLKELKNRIIRTVLSIAICSVGIFLWAGFFVCHELYPVSLAYYEYNNSIVEETSGVIDSIKYVNIDYTFVSINNTEYIMVHNDTNTNTVLGRDIVKGDTVRLQFGEKSLFIFDICKSGAAP